MILKPVDHNPFDESTAKLIPVDHNPFEEADAETNQIKAGFNTAVDTTQATGYGLVALAGDVIGSDDVRDWGMDGYKRNIEESQKNGLRVQDYTDVNNLNDAADYVLGGIGQIAPSVITMIASGGIGGLIAKYGAKKGVEKLASTMVKDGVEEKVAKAAADKMLKKAIQKGQVVGTAAGSMGMQTGGIYGDVAEQGAEGAGAITLSIGGGIVSGALDALPVIGVAKKFGFGSELKRSIESNFIKRLGKEGAKTALAEGATESTQTLIEEATKSFILDKGLPDDIAHQMINAGLLGAIGGGAMGGAAGAISKPIDPNNNTEQPTDSPIANQPDNIDLGFDDTTDIDTQIDEAVKAVSQEQQAEMQDANLNNDVPTTLDDFATYLSNDESAVQQDDGVLPQQAAEQPTQEEINAADSIAPKVPEKPETVALQLQDMLNPNTPREALLITEGEAPIDVPTGYSSVDIPGTGTLIYGDPSTLVKFMQGEDVLGYGTSEKPADTAHLTTTVRDESGAVKQDVVGNNDGINSAAEAVAGDTGTIEVRPTEEAIAERQDGVEHILPNDMPMPQYEVISKTPRQPDISPPLISETTNQPDLTASNTGAVSVSVPKELRYDIQKTGSVIVSGDGARAILEKAGIKFLPRKGGTALVGKKNAAKAIKLIKSQSPEALNRKALRSQKAAENARKRKEISATDSLELFVRKVGGIADGDFIRSFSAKEIGKTGNNFYGSLAHAKGKSADYIAELAHEAGYIQERTPQALYDALDLEVRQGVKQYATGHEIDLAEQWQRDLEAQDKLDEALFNEYGETLESVYEQEALFDDYQANDSDFILIDGEFVHVQPLTLEAAMELNNEIQRNEDKTAKRAEADSGRLRENETSGRQARQGDDNARQDNLPSQEEGQQKLLDTGKPQVSSDAIKLDDKQNKPLDLHDDNSLFGQKERAEAKAKQPDILFSRSNAKTPTSLSEVKKSWTDKGIKHFITEDEGIVTVHKIIVDEGKRGKGIGSQAMGELEAYANSKGKQIALTPSADFGGNKKKLSDFYKKRGFIKNTEYVSSEALIKDPVKFSRKKTKETSPVTLEEASVIIGRVVDRVAVSLGVSESNKIIIVDSFSDLPSSITKQADSENHDGSDVDGVFHNGNIYLVRDNLARHSDIEANTEKALLHEFVHSDMRSMFGKDITQAMNNLWLSIGGNKGIREIAKARGIDLSEYTKAGLTSGGSKAYRQAVMMDELLAHIGQVKPNLKDKVKRIIGMIRQWLRDKGLMNLAKYGETDLLNLISTARKQATQAKGGDTRFMVAYHGSPHDHNKFDMNKVGTGEGAQAYGYGLYFAGNKEVAEWYKRNLGSFEIIVDGKTIHKGNKRVGTTGNIDIDDLLISHHGKINDAIHETETDIEDFENDWRNKAHYQSLLDELNRLKKEGLVDVKSSNGKLYQVELAPKEDEYLLWDKPLSEQSDKVKESVQSALDDIVNSEPDYHKASALANEFGASEYLESTTAKEFYQSLKDGDDKAASEYLHGFGIRGIKYLDGSSRQVANYRISPPDEVKAGDWMVKGNDPTVKGVHFKTEEEAKAYIKKQEDNALNYNYVIFNDEDVSITAKYSRSKSNPSGLTVNDAKQALIKKFGNRVKRSIDAGDTVIVRTESGLPDYAKNSIEQNTESFSKDVDAFIDGSLKGSDYLHLGETPQSLTLSGGKQLPITMSQKVADKVINSKHLLSKDAIKQIPSAIADPVMVFDSATQSNSLVVMTELTDKGKTIVVAIKLNVENQRLEVNAISSIHPRENDGNFRTWIDNGLLKFANKEKSRKWFKTRGLQLPKVLNQSDFKTKYKTEKDLSQVKHSDDGKVQGAFDPVANKIYIVANNNTEASLPSVLLHEAGHSFFASEKGKEAKNKAIANIIKADSLARNGKGEVAEWVREAKKAIPKDTPPEAYYEEILAYAIQQYSEAQSKMPVTIKGIVKRLLDTMKAYVMKHTKLIFKADPALLTELARQYIGTQSSVKDGALETDVQYSKQLSDYIVQALKMLGKGEKDLFQYPDSKAKDFSDIVDDIALNGDMNAVEDASAQNVDKSWKVTMRATVKGEDATASAGVYQNGKYVWINAISLKEGVSGGSKLYHAVATYAHNNGLVFRGDPAGLKPVAHYRRLENMLSSALRFGTTDHIQPHAKQLKGLNEGGWKLSPLKWVTGDTDANIQAMLDLSAEYVYAAIPAIKDIGFDFETGAFYDENIQTNEGTNEGITEETWLRYAQSQRARKNGIGSRTLKRIVFWNALRGQKHDVLEKLSRFTHLSGLGEADGIFYSKGREYTDTQREIVEKLSNIKEGKSYKEIITDKLADFGKRWRQGAFDQFDSIRRVLKDERSWMMAHLTKSAVGVLEGVINYGSPEMHQNAVRLKEGSKGLTEILSPLGTEVDDFLKWMAGNRAKRLKKDGRENFLSSEEIETLLTLNKGKMEDGRNRTLVYAKARYDFEKLNADIVQMAVDNHLVNAEEAATWKEEGFYVPFYRAMEEESGKHHGPMVTSALIRQTAYKELKGADKPLNDLLTNVLMNWNHLISASLNNQAALSALKTATEIGAAERVNENERSKDAVFVRANGKQVWFEVSEPLVAEALAALNYDGLNNFAMKTMRAAKRWLTIGVTASPEFKLANFFRDTIQALAVADVSKNPIKNVIQGFKATKAGGKTDINMLMGGGGFGDSGYIHGNDPDAVKKLVKLGKGGTLISDPKNFITHTWKVYQDIGAKLENVNRAANFEQALADGKDLLTANFEARDHLDFSRTGSWVTVRALTQVIPFLNARLQGIDKIARAGMDKNQRAQFMAVVGYYSLLSVALYAAMADDDDYKNAEDWDRDTYHLIKLSKIGLPAINDADGNEIMFRLPRPFEVGAIANMAERMTEQVFDADSKGKDFTDAVKFTFTQTFAFNPIPQLFKPWLEVYSNKNSFTGRRIESMGMKYKPVTERSKPWTSDTAVVVSKSMNAVAGDDLTLSPVQIEHLVKGYFGWAGQAILGATDMLITRHVLDTPERPDWRVDEYPVLKRFIQTTPKRYIKQTGEFYDRMERINNAYNAIKLYRKDHNKDAVDDVIAEHKGEFKYRKMLNLNAARIRKLNKQSEAIYKDRAMSGGMKKLKLSVINKKKNEIYLRAVKASDSAFN